MAGATSTNTITEVKPVIKEFIGTIGSVSDQLVRGDNKFRMITLVSRNEEVSFPVNEKFYQRNENRFKEDMIVHLSVETRIANKTTYADRETGELKQHTKDGDTIISVRKATSREMSLLYREDDFSWASDKLESVDANKAAAYATLLGSMLK